MTTKKTTNAKKTPAKPVKKTTKTTKRISADAKITVLATTNPRREGTTHYKHFTLYTNGMTVAAFTKKGGNRGDLRCDVKDGHIAVA